MELQNLEEIKRMPDGKFIQLVIDPEWSGTSEICYAVRSIST